ncbi:dynein axonemal assembly factor 4-like isoform X2 [Haliotis rubra]|uniref:dynein axonemal assembly factor 4-like isoform X2 n=1 Tax=Haliotis rubra TaxID=36100 RepID=UPI001EE5CB40|nr:dynein axonemal assembly factor 4-like isoform X2 [Haliotis rubra]
MPLIVKDFSWDENESTLFLTVPLKGVKANKVDIFSSEEYIKVSYPPYIFECLLKSPVDDAQSSANVGNGTVVFKLKKKEPEIWGQLQSDDAGNKEVMRKKREESQAQEHSRQQEAGKAKAEKKREDDRYAINQMMKLEDSEKQRIENIKQSERKAATDALERWKDEQKAQAEAHKQHLLEQQREENERKKIEERKKGKKTSIFETGKGAPTRQSGRIEVSHTPRVFPTPVRESQAPMEEEWLRKQAEARKTVELADADLSEEEKNPLWLRDKGNEFFKAGDYQAAVNAYTHAIRLRNQMPGLYSNRAACHLKLRNLIKCIEDCSKAMDLLHPPVPQNAASRCKALVRRGTAFCQLEMYIEGLQDYGAALKLDRDNKGLQADAEKIREIIQGTVDR